MVGASVSFSLALYHSVQDGRWVTRTVSVPTKATNVPISSSNERLILFRTGVFVFDSLEEGALTVVAPLLIL